MAVDHNSLLMDVMSKVGERHDFKVLFHEKPFKGVNGSGKHNNWSMATDTGVNLLSPGKTPMSNLQFLSFFINTIKAVQEYEEPWSSWSLAENIIKYFDDYKDEYEALSEEDKDYIIDYLQTEIDREENDKFIYEMQMEAYRDYQMEVEINY